MRKEQPKKSLSLKDFKSFEVKNANNIIAGGGDPEGVAGIMTKRPKGMGQEEDE